MTNARQLSTAFALFLFPILVFGLVLPVAAEDPPKWPDLKKAAPEVQEVVPGFLWIDAEDFKDYGGWTLDTQFVHLMGSGYLLAASVGRPVEDATTTVDIREAGTYRIWVRAKNWFKEHSPGQFRLLVNRSPAKPVFGTEPTENWCWRTAGDFKLPAGLVSLALHDTTGYYGRCDAILLTTDLNYVPPDKTQDIAKERARLTGRSLEPKQGGTFDVVVVGAGAAGTSAAIASARNGAKTAIIQNRPVLGGNASIELGVPICGAAGHQANAREGGIIEEALRIKTRFGYHKMSEPFRILAEREKNLTVFYNKHVFDVVMDGKRRIRAVRAVDTLDGDVTEYAGKIFIDGTGDGWVGFYAKADYRMGRESRDVHGEDLAPESGDRITLSGCIMGRLALSLRAIETDHPVKFVRPEWAPKIPDPVGYGRHIRNTIGGNWWLEHPGDIDDLYDAERARDELIRISYGYWDYIKNRWPQRNRAKNCQLVYVPYMDAKRESRRLLGDHILTQNDVLAGTVFPDAIAHGGWPLDIHHPQGIYSGEEGAFDYNAKVPLYTIPYRCVYSRNIDNLLMAGRDMSVTHVALGTVRVQGTLSAIAQGAGTAAAMCVEKDVSPRELGKQYIEQLRQRLLKDDQFIPGAKNEDPADLARTASVRATSQADRLIFDRDRISPGDAHELNTIRAAMFPAAIKGPIRSAFVLLKSDLKKPTRVTCDLHGSSDFADFSSEKVLSQATQTVPPGGPRWVRFDFPEPVNVETPFLWISLSKARGVWCFLAGEAPPGSCRAYGGPKWTVLENQYYAVAFDPPVGTAQDGKAENVINGFSRPIGTRRNQWISDPSKHLPQSIELTFAKKTRLEKILLTFDTNVDTRRFAGSVPQECVRDYELAFFDGHDWKPLTTVKDNYQRRRVHTFAPIQAERLRLTVTATHGDKSARVFEVRAY
ncbi:MAG: FAD-dependent oxidoreductase [Pirellulales bacterium]|nr:FAD-dependent oxidoreductase [Pirellulales bacterium]